MLLLPDGDSDADAVIEELTAKLHDEDAEAQRLASLGGVVVTDAATVLDDADPKLSGLEAALIRLALAEVTVTPGRVPLAQRVGVVPLG